MARVLRFELPGEVFHIISRCARDRWILDQADPQRAAFRQALKVAQERSDTEVLAYAAMSNHLHLVVLAGKDPLGLFMKRFLGGLAWSVNRRLGDSGALVGGRFRALLVEKEAYLCQLISYVHANPLRAGVARSVWDGSWTSAAAFLGESDPAVLPLRVTELLDTSLAGLRQEIDAFAATAVQRSPVFSMDSVAVLERKRQEQERLAGRPVTRTGPFLGGARFRARLFQKVPELTGRIEAPDGLGAGIVEAPAAGPSVGVLLDLVLQGCGCDGWGTPHPGRPPRELSLARRLALDLGQELLGSSVRTLAPRLRISEEAAFRVLSRPSSPSGARRGKQIRERWRWATAQNGESHPGMAQKPGVRPPISIDV